MQRGEGAWQVGPAGSRRVLVSAALFIVPVVPTCRDVTWFHRLNGQDDGMPVTEAHAETLGMFV